MNPSSPALPPLQPEPPAQSTRVVRFGVFEVDLQTAELRKQGVRIRLCGAFEMHRCFTGQGVDLRTPRIPRGLFLRSTASASR
jgi:hypothetical protein